MTNLKDVMGYDPPVGCRLADDFPQIHLKALSKRPLPDYFKAGLYRFISARLKQHLEEMRIPGFECRPVHIKHRGQVLTDTHFHLHVFQALDCLDLVQSTYEINEGLTGPYVSKIHQMHLDESKIGDCPLFIMGTPGTEYILIVSDSLAEYILRSKFTGCAFKLPADIGKFFSYDAPRYKTLGA